MTSAGLYGNYIRKKILPQWRNSYFLAVFRHCRPWRGWVDKKYKWLVLRQYIESVTFMRVSASVSHEHVAAAANQWAVNLLGSFPPSWHWVKSAFHWLYTTPPAGFHQVTFLAFEGAGSQAAGVHLIGHKTHKKNSNKNQEVPAAAASHWCSCWVVLKVS